MLALILFASCSSEPKQATLSDILETGSPEQEPAEEAQPTAEPAEPSQPSEPATDSADSATDTAEDPDTPYSSMWNVDNFSASTDLHADTLIEQAIAGLGFAADSVQGPNQQDRYFVGRHYIAWIDQTGFHGKINGIWQLNGESGDSLDFAYTEDGRALNMLIIGENGNGEFPGGYPGAEHAEFPNRTPEENDNPNCATTDWCNQYAHEEAADFSTDIPWWSACNTGSISWDTLLLPTTEESEPDAIKLVWEAPLVKEADGDGTFDGDDCHADWLFEDGVRRTVYLRAGYKLYGDQNHIDRFYQFRNPAGNPDFSGPMSVIGGYVITRWPNPHPLKSFDQWLKPEQNGFDDNNHNMTFHAGQWNDHRHEPVSGDEVFGWIAQPFSMSALPVRVAGRNAKLSNIASADNDDVGICLCGVHGGIEMGGGLLHGGISLPIAGGETSMEAVRRLDFGGATQPSQAFLYPAETLAHATGVADSVGWVANTADHSAGHMIYGPYAVDWQGDAGEAVFAMSIDDHTANSEVVVSIDVYDSTANQTIAFQNIKRDDFTSTGTQSFRLGFDFRNRTGHTMETRVYWHDKAQIRAEYISVDMWMEQ